VCSLRTWISRHPFRAVVYALVLSVAVLSVVDVWLLHGRISGALAVRLAQLPAVRSVAQFRTARVACCETKCLLLTEVDGLSFTPPGSNGLGIDIGRVSTCNSEAKIDNFTLRDAAKRSLVSAAGVKLDLAAVPLDVKIDGIALGSNPSLATVGSADLRAELRDREIVIAGASANDIHAADDLLAIPNVSIARTSVPRTPDPEIVVPLVTVSGAAARLERRSDGSWKLPDAAQVQALASSLQEAYALLLANYAKIAPAVRAFAFWLVVVVTVAVIAGKLALTAAGLWLRVISAAIPAGAGYLLYLLAVRNPAVYLATGAAIAAGLVIAIYRKSPEWHQRMEPALVDLVSPVLIGLSLMVHAFALAPLPGQPRHVTIAQVLIGPTSASLLAAGVGSAAAEVAGVEVDRIRLDLALPGIQIDRVQANTSKVTTSPDALRSSVPQILAEGIRAGKGSAPRGSVSLRGVAQSPLLANQLDKFHFLPDTVRRPAPATFCMAWNLGVELPAGCQAGDALAVRGSVDLADLNKISFAVDTTVRASGVAIGSSAAGDTTSARLTRIRSLPASSVRIDAGRGQFTWSGGVRGQIDLEHVEASGFRTDKLALRTDIASQRQLTAHAAAQQMRGPVGGGEVTLESVVLNVTRNAVTRNAVTRNAGPAGDPVTSQTSIRNLRFSSPTIDASMTELSAQIAGWLRPDRFQGTFAFAAPSASLRPLDFSLDPFAGTLSIADQPFQFDQAAVSFLQPRISGRMEANAVIQPLAYHAAAQLDPLALSLLPWRTEMKSLQATVDSPSRVTFESTLHAAFPPVPASFQFEQVSRLKLTSEGSLKGTPIRSNPLPAWTVPPLPEEFRISGSLGGAVTIATQSGSLELAKPAAALRKLVLNNGRLAEVILHADVDDVSTDVALDGSPAHVKVSGSLPGARDWRLELDSQRVHVAAPDVHLQTLWPAAAPLLKRFGYAFDGIRPVARLQNIDGIVTFSAGQLSSVHGGLEIAAGPLGAVDLLPPFGTATADAARPVSLHAELSPAAGDSFALTATVRAPSTSARLESDRGSLTLASAIDAEARGLLTRAEAPRTPVMSRLLDTFTALGPHAQSAADAFGIEAGDISWNVDAANDASGQPALSAGPERLSANLDVPRMEIAAGAVRVSGSSRVALDLAAHGDALIADGRMPVDIQYSLSGAPPERQQLEIPILAAFTTRFPQAASQGDLLWKPDQVAAVWNGYQIRRANTGPVRIFERPELTLGNLSLRQLRIPDAPAALTIAVSDRLQFNVPLSGSALFGVVDGIAQGEVAWKNGLASLTGRVQGTLNGMQADAVSLLLGGVNSPLVRDQWNTAFAFRGDDVLLNRDRLTALLRDPGSSDAIDHVGLRLVAGRTDASQADAYLQLSSYLDLPGLHGVLKDLLQRFAVQAPPQMMRYHDFKLALETDGDRVIGSSPLLSVSGFRFQPPVLATDVAADLRLHLGRPGRDKITVRGLLNYVRSIQ
jgi:hypothetical protein